jgi:hypothetical protein
MWSYHKCCIHDAAATSSTAASAANSEPRKNAVSSIAPRKQFREYSGLNTYEEAEIAGKIRQLHWSSYHAQDDFRSDDQRNVKRRGKNG